MDQRIADGAGVFPCSPAEGSQQHSFDPAVEARLAHEVRGLVDALIQFGAGFKAIGEASSGDDLGKVVALMLQLFCAQFANVLLKGGDPEALLGDFAEKLVRSGLKFEEAFREVEFDGRKFLCIAFMNEREGEVFDRSARRE